MKTETCYPLFNPQPIKYPILVRCNTSGIIYLFTNLTCAVKLTQGNLDYSLLPVGNFSGTMLPLCKPGQWEILPKGFKITLEQE